MVRRTTLLSLLVFLPAALGQQPSHPWSSSAPGDWVLVEEEEQLGDNDPKRNEQREELVADHGIRIVLRVTPSGAPGDELEATGGDRSIWPGETPQSLGMKEESREEGVSYSLGDRKVTCTKTTWTLERPGMGWKGNLTLWQSDEVELPSRLLPSDGPTLLLGSDVLRAEYALDMGGGNRGSYGMQVVALAQPRNVGGQSVPCVHEVGSTQRIHGLNLIDGVMERWSSPDVPGHVVLEDSTSSTGDRQMRRVRRVLAFGRAEAAPPELPPPPPLPAETLPPFVLNLVTTLQSDDEADRELLLSSVLLDAETLAELGAGEGRVEALASVRSSTHPLLAQIREAEVLGVKVGTPEESGLLVPALEALLDRADEEPLSLGLFIHRAERWRWIPPAHPGD